MVSAGSYGIDASAQRSGRQHPTAGLSNEPVRMLQAGEMRPLLPASGRRARERLRLAEPGRSDGDELDVDARRLGEGMQVSGVEGEDVVPVRGQADDGRVDRIRSA